MAPRRGDETRCDDSFSGSWPVLAGTEMREACVARCRNCSNCHFVSFADVSFAGARGRRFAGGHALCTWHSYCDTDDLRHWWDASIAGANWTTLRVRPRREPVEVQRPAAANATRIHIGIAVLIFGEGHECDLIGWCQSALRLQRVLDTPPWNADILVLHTGTPPELKQHCPAAKFIRASNYLRRLASHCLERHPFRTGAPSDAMLKWQVMALTSFDVILHVDADVDVMPIDLRPSLVLERWQTHLPVFLKPRRLQRVDGSRGSAGMRLLGQTDFTSPLNGGLLLLRPSTLLYKACQSQVRE
jgi:hypothetical protein